MDKKKRILFVLRILVSAALLFALFKLVPYSQLHKVYLNSRPEYLLGGFFIFCLCFCAGIWRWHFLLGALGIHQPLREIACAYLGGFFLNLFFPSFIAGDICRAATVTYSHGAGTRVISSVLMDRVSGLIGLSLLCSGAYAWGGALIPHTQVRTGVFILCGTVSVVCLFIFSKTFFSRVIRFLPESSRIVKKLKELHELLFFFRENPRFFAGAVGISLIIHTLTAVFFFVVARGFGVSSGVIYFLIMIPLVMMIAFVPVTVAGTGTREAAMIYFLSFIGVDKSVSFGISLVHLFFFLMVGMIGGIIYVSVCHRWIQRNP